MTILQCKAKMQHLQTITVCSFSLQSRMASGTSHVHVGRCLDSGLITSMLALMQETWEPLNFRFGVHTGVVFCDVCETVIRLAMHRAYQAVLWSDFE